MKKGNHNHGNCECEACKTGIEAMKQKFKEMMDKYGWYAQFILDETGTPYNTNMHTHGFSETYKHKDIQICFPVRPETSHSIFITIAERIKKGEVFEPGKRYSKVLGKGYDVMFIEAEEKDRPVLRLIFPNEDGSFEGGMAEEQMQMPKKIVKQKWYLSN